MQKIAGLGCRRVLTMVPPTGQRIHLQVHTQWCPVRRDGGYHYGRVYLADCLNPCPGCYEITARLKIHERGKRQDAVQDRRK
jgi:hypothetical protein